MGEVTIKIKPTVITELPYATIIDKALLWTAGLPPPFTFLLVLAYTLIAVGIGWWLGK